ncbi:hypothetical protein BJ742DRAFT_370749 [Cladochytrium replicatum]|nr:hypothetical protein BJ742DRAFT_370749 [Cladochytrium replicatum]
MTAFQGFVDRFTGRGERTTSSRVWTKITLSVAILQAVLVIAFEAYIMSTINSFLRLGFANGTSTLPAGTLPFIFVYQALFILAQVFLIALVADAAWVKNTLQIISCAVFNTLCLAFSIVQIFQIAGLNSCVQSIISGKQVKGLIKSATGCPEYEKSSLVANQLSLNQRNLTSLLPFEIIVAVISLVFCVASWYIALRTYKNWGWQIYHRSTGADLNKRAILRRYHLFVMLMKYNVYFCAGMIVQFIIVLFFQSSDRQTAGKANAFTDKATLTWLIVVTAVALVYFVLGWLAVRRGNRILMVLFQIVILLNLGAVVGMVGLAFVVDDYASVFDVSRVFFTIFAGASAIINVALFVIGVYCIKGFSHPGYIALGMCGDTTVCVCASPFIMQFSVTPPPIHLSNRNQQQQMVEVPLTTQQRGGVLELS